MSFKANKGKDFIYIIPVVFLLVVVYLMLYRDSELVDSSKKEVEVGEIKKVDPVKEIKNIKKEKMENLEIGKKYTTDSGLQFEVMVLGDGVKPEVSDIVEVHYHGTLENGTVFDSSVQRGQTIEFGLNQVITGWTEGLQLMPVGSKFKFVIPSNLAYGDASPSPLIPGGSTLVFEVELFDVK
jgi:FKBP-type peptidyl-prolyl cis-trans isomerase